MPTFAEAKDAFDRQHELVACISSLVPVHVEPVKTVTIRNAQSERLEEYYKWQLVYALIASGMYSKDSIGAEVYFPKGNKSAAPLKMDIAIFDDPSWYVHYNSYWSKRDQTALDWLREHLLGVIELKRAGETKNIDAIYNTQLKPGIKESERDFCIGAIYDRERLYLFRKFLGKCVRLVDDYNTKGLQSGTKDLSLHLTDPYVNFPTFAEVVNWNGVRTASRANRNLDELTVISSVHSVQINDAMSEVLRQMDKKGMVNQKGYEILVQVLALKIFDEKRNDSLKSSSLQFYVEPAERSFSSLNEPGVQNFVERMGRLKDDAEQEYPRVLYGSPLSLTNENHIRVLIEIVEQFQDYSFVRSQKTDLYQLVFYRFATPLAKDQNAQFVTPLPLIDFLVGIVNPRSGESLLDPTVGIADFLSVAYVNSNGQLSDTNIYGIDIDEQMVMLATLNMLLNGDGNARLHAVPGYGSLLQKFDINGNLIELIPGINDHGNWDSRRDGKKLKKFDVILTNPPFGEDRAFRIRDARDREVIQCYELWDRGRAGDWIDLGLVFLENAYHLLKDGGRLGIVLSNSIASIDRWRSAREWLLEKLRIVAVFDLPPRVFAETDVNTTMLVAYKPTQKQLENLQRQDYAVFSREIHKVGYEIRTAKRVKKFEPLYRMNTVDFSVEIDREGRPMLDEDFTRTIQDFKLWCLTQEDELQRLFIRN